MPRNALQPEMRPTPRNRIMGLFADALTQGRDFADRAQIPPGVPLVGGQGIGSMLMGKTPEELNEWSYGNAPMRINPLAGRTASFVPEVKPGRKQGLADALGFASSAPGRNALMMGMGAMDGGAAQAAMMGARKTGPSPQVWRTLDSRDNYPGGSGPFGGFETSEAMLAHRAQVAAEESALKAAWDRVRASWPPAEASPGVTWRTLAARDQPVDWSKTWAGMSEADYAPLAKKRLQP